MRRYVIRYSGYNVADDFKIEFTTDAVFGTAAFYEAIGRAVADSMTLSVVGADDSDD